MNKHTTTQKQRKKFPESLFKRSLLALAMAGLSNHVIAQETSEEKPVEDDSIEVISVTGIRGALATAAQLKREANTFVDSITAADASVLPDLSVAEALSRVPGVTVTRFASGGSNGDFPSPEGSGNLVRGLGFVRSEFNGRDAFSASGGRALDWSAIPPELIGGVDVYKNQSADLIEGGIGGTVNLRTLEPFDREGTVAVFAADTTYTDLREKWSPSYSGVLGDRWETSKGEFGLLASFSTSDLGSRIHGFQQSPPAPRAANHNVEYADGSTPTGAQNIAVTSGFQLRTNDIDRTRDSYYVAGQWASPDENMELLFKYARVENESSSVERTTEWFPDANSAGRVSISDLVVSPFSSDGVAICSGSNESSIGACDATLPVTGGLMEEGLVTDNGDSWYGAYGLGVSTLGVGKQDGSTTEDFSLNMKWNVSGQWYVELDAQHTKADSVYNELWSGGNFFSQAFVRHDDETPYVEFSNDPRLEEITSIRDGGTNQVPYSVPTSTGDPGGTHMQFASDAYREGEGDLTALKADVQYDFEDAGWFQSVKFGVRHSEREQINKSAGGNWAAVSPAWDGGIARYNAFDTEIHEVVDFSDFFRGGVVGGDNSSFVYTSGEYLSNPEKFFDFVLNEPDLNGSHSENGRPVQWNPLARNRGEGTERRVRNSDGTYTNVFQPDDTSDVKEETINLYVRFDFSTDFDNGMDLDGNFGMRYVKTDLTSHGRLDYPEIDDDEDDINWPGYPNFEDPEVLGDDGEPVYPNAQLYPPEAEARDHMRDFLPETVAFLSKLDTPRDVDMTNEYYLPSFNLKLNLNEDMLVRFAVSKAMTLPNIQDLRAAQSINALAPRVNFDPLEEDDPNFGIARGIQNIPLNQINIRGGNPNLEPTIAVGWDLSFEWYFDEGDTFSASLFSKDIENIITQGVDVIDTITLDGNTVNYQYVGQVNSNEAELTGIEFSYQQFFDSLPGYFANLGVQSNYTYIDADQTPPPAFLDADDDGEPDPGSFGNNLRWGLNNLLGQSRHTANLIGIYQDDAFEARLAYQWRSEYLNSYRDFVTGNPIFQNAAGYLDMSLKYNLTENIQVSFQGSNILDVKSKSNSQIDLNGQRYHRSSFLNDRRFKFAIRYAL